MEIWDFNKLYLFIFFVIPGFVSLKTYELIFVGYKKDASNLIVDAVAYSCINYSILFFFIFQVESNNLKIDYPVWYALFYACVFFIAPVVWVLILKKLRQSNWMQKWLPHPTARAWDYVFGKNKPYWVIINLKDGKKIAGLYGTNSFTTSGNFREEVFLEKAWRLNKSGGFERERTNSEGVLVVSSEIESLEFFKCQG